MPRRLGGIRIKYNMQKGYRSYVEVYDETFYVDTFTGEGFDSVIKTIEPLLNKYSSSTFINGMSQDDIFGELRVIAIEGIKKFDPTRNVKLSTFLQFHVNNKNISAIMRANRQKRCASTINKLELKDERGYNVAPAELTISDLMGGRDAIGDRSPDDILGGLAKNDLYNGVLTDQKHIDFSLSLRSVIKNFDPSTKKIVEMMYFKDYDTRDVARAMGTTEWKVTAKLKKLARNGNMRSIFGLTNDIKSSVFVSEDSEDYEDYGDYDEGRSGEGKS